MPRAALYLIAVLLLLGLFCALNAVRIPKETFPRYDEATHIHLGLQVRDDLRHGDLQSMVQLIFHKRVLKGILYRYYFGIAQCLGPPGTDTARFAGLAAYLGALLCLFFLARSIAPLQQRNLAGYLAVMFGVGAPLANFWSRTAMVEPLNLLFITLAFLCLVRHRRRGTLGSAVLAGAALLLAFYTKFNQALILFGAVGLDALIEGLLRRGRPLRERLQPMLPLAIAFFVIALWFLEEERREAFAYYIWTIPGGENPLDFTGWIYARTLGTKMAPWIAGTVLFYLALLAGLWQGRKSGARLLLIHLAAGLVLAQMNALKLERILVPLSNDFFALAGAGGAALLAPLLRRLRPWAAPALMVLLTACYFAAPAFFRVKAHPLRKLDRVLDAGLDLSAGANKTLWIGQGYIRGQHRLSTAHVLVRAEERGRPVTPGSFRYVSSEMFHRIGLDRTGAKVEGLTPEMMSKILKGMDAVIVVFDAAPGGPSIKTPLSRKLAQLVAQSSAFKVVDTREIPLPGIHSDPSACYTRVVLFRRQQRGG
jgi:4-amino-4-deoxy-L-arabinose transferase-like glycosyltransferase